MTSPAQETNRLAVEMRGIVKSFPGVVANDHVDLDVPQGEILALVGENGAGKSTLMNILYGLIKAEAGEILIADPGRPGSHYFLDVAGDRFVHSSTSRVVGGVTVTIHRLRATAGSAHGA